MLTGHAVFAGDSVSEILSEVLKSEPDWRRLPAETPEGIRRLLRRSLQKDRKVRLHDIADARIEIDDARSAPLMSTAAAPRGLDEPVNGSHGCRRPGFRDADEPPSSVVRGVPTT